MATELHEKSGYISSVEAVNCGADMDEETSSLSSGCGCGCLQGLFCFGWFQKNCNIKGLSSKCNLLERRQEGEEEVVMVVDKENWLVKTAKKVKEVSEVLAGPKWKNFIRSINKKRKTTSTMQFQYDPQSYALNFDDGVHVYNEPQANYLQFFSTRYSAPAPQGIFNDNT